MNSLIQLKGQLTPRKNPSRGGGTTLPKDTNVNVEKLESIKQQLETLKSFWNSQSLIDGALINVKYNRIVPKSKRISAILFRNPEREKVESIKGAKYVQEEKLKHIITYFIPISNLDYNISRIEESINILNNHFNGNINEYDIDKLKTIDFSKFKISKSAFIEIINDCAIVEKVEKPEYTAKAEQIQAITLYEVNKTVKEICDELKIEYKDRSIIDDNTIIIFKEALEKLIEKAPYLISMTVSDISEYHLEDVDKSEEERKKVRERILNLPSPSNEPTIGVLDTGFDTNSYFSEWVDYTEAYMDDEGEITEEDRIHGTSVDCIIVDGPSNNPEFDDGCGRFKVRHFCIARKGHNSTFAIMRRIKKIISENPDIKVWNLSLGAESEINDNFISQEGALLDKLQIENDIIFVVAGTNKDLAQEKIGSPADSINSLVVNSIKKSGEKVSYARKGKVLHFFNKPDIAYYGGDKGEEMRTGNSNGEYLTMGTSIAAPWISRKMGYLIYKLGLSREIAKALLIDSATGWQKINEEKAEYHGFGNVPIRIEDIINSPKNEIKFYIEGESNDFDTYTYGIPVPIDKDKCPYIAKATLCYFPKCTRNQGVDYTNTELDLYFGRVYQNSRGNISIKTINNNKQSDEDGRVLEEDARKYNRKWDNVKHIVEEYKPTARPKKNYENPLWGLSVKSKDRLGRDDGKGIKFGVVITLREINGENRYDEFIRQCAFRGWIVNKVDVENRLELYNIAEEEIEFE